MPHLGLLTVLVRDYDEAIRFYTEALGFTLAEDVALPTGARWVVVRPDGASPTGFLLALAADPVELGRIGAQTGQRVFAFLHTEDFARDHARMVAGGVKFLEQPRVEVYGTVAVFEDLYGNRFDLIQPA
ncbi:VOC family protein [Crossiella sp. CA198]|uniref:VOC family protein n=1 Tax=Crossiella sp. CA198 TaxID=3455607 RepID=UPI003F8D850C